MDDNVRNCTYFALGTWVATLTSVGIGWWLHPTNVSVYNSVDVPASKVQVTNEVKPARVEVVHIRPPDFRIDVRQPVVNVESAKVEVHPPEVNVTVQRDPIPISVPRGEIQNDLPDRTAEAVMRAIEAKEKKDLGELGPLLPPQPK